MAITTKRLHEPAEKRLQLERDHAEVCNICQLRREVSVFLELNGNKNIPGSVEEKPEFKLRF